jgi:hypothetical protein
MSFTMARDAQRDTERGVKQTGLVSRSRHELLPQNVERNSMVMGVEIYPFVLAGTCAAILAGVAITLIHSVSPGNIELGLAQYLVLLGYSALPISCVLAGAFAGTFYCSEQELSGVRIVARDEARNTEAAAVHVGLDENRTSTSAFAEMLALMFSNPAIHAAIVCAGMIAGIGLADGPTHSPYGIKFNTGLQAKWGELLETRLASAKGNQQPSTVNGDVLAVKVQRLAGEEPTNKPATAPHAKAMI